MPGYWQWDARASSWVSGRYALPTANAEWQAPSWRPRSGGVVFVPGRWAVRVR
ncbi:MAG: YXWGXW repeat-containing protein [Sandaracinaceae bacterium]|nr:YXWGXW repeat-containing protein [Sandaracinaceae bacterium]